MTSERKSTWTSGLHLENFPRGGAKIGFQKYCGGDAFSNFNAQ